MQQPVGPNDHQYRQQMMYPHQVHHHGGVQYVQVMGDNTSDMSQVSQNAPVQQPMYMLATPNGFLPAPPMAMANSLMQTQKHPFRNTQDAHMIDQNSALNTSGQLQRRMENPASQSKGALLVNALNQEPPAQCDSMSFYRRFKRVNETGKGNASSGELKQVQKFEDQCRRPPEIEPQPLLKPGEYDYYRTTNNSSTTHTRQMAQALDQQFQHGKNSANYTRNSQMIQSHQLKPNQSILSNGHQQPIFKNGPSASFSSQFTQVREQEGPNPQVLHTQTAFGPQDEYASHQNFQNKNPMMMPPQHHLQQQALQQQSKFAEQKHLEASYEYQQQVGQPYIHPHYFVHPANNYPVSPNEYSRPMQYDQASMMTNSANKQVRFKNQDSSQAMSQRCDDNGMVSNEVDLFHSTSRSRTQGVDESQITTKVVRQSSILNNRRSVSPISASKRGNGERTVSRQEKHKLAARKSTSSNSKAYRGDLSRRSKSNKSRLSQASSISLLSAKKDRSKSAKKKGSTSKPHSRSVMQEQNDEYNKFSVSDQRKVTQPNFNESGKSKRINRASSKKAGDSKSSVSRSKSVQRERGHSKKKYSTILIETDGLSSYQISQIDKVSKILNNERLYRSPERRTSKVNTHANSKSNKKRGTSAKKKTKKEADPSQAYASQFGTLISAASRSKNREQERSYYFRDDEPSYITTPNLDNSHISCASNPLKQAISNQSQIMRQLVGQNQNFRVNSAQQEYFGHPAIQNVRDHHLMSQNVYPTQGNNYQKVHGQNETISYPQQTGPSQNTSQKLLYNEYNSPKYTLDYPNSSNLTGTNEFNENYPQSNALQSRDLSNNDAYNYQPQSAHGLDTLHTIQGNQSNALDNTYQSNPTQQTYATQSTLQYPHQQYQQPYPQTVANVELKHHHVMQSFNSGGQPMVMSSVLNHQPPNESAFNSAHNLYKTDHKANHTQMPSHNDNAFMDHLSQKRDTVANSVLNQSQITSQKQYNNDDINEVVQGDSQDSDRHHRRDATQYADIAHARIETQESQHKRDLSGGQAAVEFSSQGNTNTFEKMQEKARIWRTTGNPSQMHEQRNDMAFEQSSSIGNLFLQSTVPKHEEQDNSYQMNMSQHMNASANQHDLSKFQAQLPPNMQYQSLSQQNLQGISQLINGSSQQYVLLQQHGENGQRNNQQMKFISFNDSARRVSPLISQKRLEAQLSSSAQNTAEGNQTRSNGGESGSCSRVQSKEDKITTLVDPIQEDQNEHRLTESDQHHGPVPPSHLRYENELLPKSFETTAFNPMGSGHINFQSKMQGFTERHNQLQGAQSEYHVIQPNLSILQSPEGMLLSDLYKSQLIRNQQLQEQLSAQKSATKKSTAVASAKKVKRSKSAKPDITSPKENDKESKLSKRSQGPIIIKIVRTKSALGKSKKMAERDQQRSVSKLSSKSQKTTKTVKSKKSTKSCGAIKKKLKNKKSLENKSMKSEKLSQKSTKVKKTSTKTKKAPSSRPKSKAAQNLSTARGYDGVESIHQDQLLHLNHLNQQYLTNLNMLYMNHQQQPNVQSAPHQFQSHHQHFNSVDLPLMHQMDGPQQIPTPAALETMNNQPAAVNVRCGDFYHHRVPSPDGHIHRQSPDELGHSRAATMGAGLQALTFAQTQNQADFININESHQMSGNFIKADPHQMSGMSHQEPQMLSDSNDVNRNSYNASREGPAPATHHGLQSDPQINEGPTAVQALNMVTDQSVMSQQTVPQVASYQQLEKQVSGSFRHELSGQSRTGPAMVPQSSGGNMIFDPVSNKVYHQQSNGMLFETDLVVHQLGGENTRSDQTHSNQNMNRTILNESEVFHLVHQDPAAQQAQLNIEQSYQSHQQQMEQQCLPPKMVHSETPAFYSSIPNLQKRLSTQGSRNLHALPLPEQYQVPALLNQRSGHPSNQGPMHNLAHRSSQSISDGRQQQIEYQDLHDGRQSCPITNINIQANHSMSRSATGQSKSGAALASNPYVSYTNYRQCYREKSMKKKKQGGRLATSASGDRVQRSLSQLRPKRPKSSKQKTKKRCKSALDKDSKSMKMRSAKPNGKSRLYRNSIDRIVKGQLASGIDASKRVDKMTRSVILPKRRLILSPKKDNDFVYRTFGSTRPNKSAAQTSRRKLHPNRFGRNLFRKQQALISRLHSAPRDYTTSKTLSRLRQTSALQTIPHAHQRLNRSVSPFLGGKSKTKPEFLRTFGALTSQERTRLQSVNKMEKQLQIQDELHNQKLVQAERHWRSRVKFLKHSVDVEKTRAQGYKDTLRQFNHNIEHIKFHKHSRFNKVKTQKMQQDLIKSHKQKVDSLHRISEKSKQAASGHVSASNCYDNLVNINTRQFNKDISFPSEAQIINVQSNQEGLTTMNTNTNNLNSKPAIISSYQSSCRRGDNWSPSKPKLINESSKERKVSSHKCSNQNSQLVLKKSVACGQSKPQSHFSRSKNSRATVHAQQNSHANPGCPTNFSSLEGIIDSNRTNIQIQRSKMLEPNFQQMGGSMTNSQAREYRRNSAMRNLPKSQIYIGGGRLMTTFDGTPGSNQRAPDLGSAEQLQFINEGSQENPSQVFGHLHNQHSQQLDQDFTMTQTSATSSEFVAPNLALMTNKFKDNNREIKRIENILYKDDRKAAKHHRPPRELLSKNNENLMAFSQRVKQLESKKMSATMRISERGQYCGATTASHRLSSGRDMHHAHEINEKEKQQIQLMNAQSVKNSMRHLVDDISLLKLAKIDREDRREKNRSSRPNSYYYRKQENC